MEKFETEIIEPEEKKPEYNPLDEAVNEKAYTTPNVNTSNVNLNIPIEEPRFTPPPIDTKNNIKGDSKPPKPDPINPEMRNLSKKDTDVAASHMAKLILQGYEWMHDLANKGLKVSERKLNKLQSDGEINLNAMIDYDYGKNIRAGDFFIEYNQQVENVLQVSPEFKEEVTPILEKVLAKRGVGMTDEQMLMFMFGKDIAAKSMIFFQQKAQMNLMIASIKEATTSQYAQAAPPPSPKPQPQEPTPQTTPPPATHKAEVIAVEPEEYELEPKRIRQRGRPKKV
jgi:hypothetical protein